MSEYVPNNMNQEIGWDDVIQNDSEFTVVPEGDYTFTVKKFERGRHNGSDRLPPCNKAILTIEVSNGHDKTTLTHNLFLHRKTEGMLCAFFTAIGQRKHGEALQPKWGQVMGSKGTCKVSIRTWTGNDGQPRQSNEIKKFYEPAAQPAAAPVQQPQQTSFTPGKF